MSSRKKVIVGIGELLWDMLPSGKQAGGAPGNFAYQVCRLGDTGLVVSRVGEDDMGRELVDLLEGLGLSCKQVQRDKERPTGRSLIEVDDEGVPTFNVVENVAWDFIEWTADLERLAKRADAVYFDTLALRAPASRETAWRLLGELRPDAVRIFDFNLRPPFYSEEPIRRSLEMADLVKTNDEELPKVMKMLGLEAGEDEIETARILIGRFDLDLLFVTRGPGGSLCVTRDDLDEQPGIEVEVEDTVGAGDAFTAALIHNYLRGSSLERMNRAANALGAWVAGQKGATPVHTTQILEKVKT
jgi:fructokinase